jgi:predicted phosphoribosyltransferase
MNTHRNRLDVLELAATLNLRLLPYREDPNAILLSLLQSGLGLASILSGLLHIPRHVFIAENLRAPCKCPCTIGALTETNFIFMDQRVIARQQWPYRELRAFIEREMQTQRAEIARQKEIHRAEFGLPELGGRNVVFVNDGTAATTALIASIESFRKLDAGKIVLAVPSLSIPIIRDIQHRVDEIVVAYPGDLLSGQRRAEGISPLDPPRVA